MNAVTVVTDQVPKSLQELKQWVDTHFHCMHGPPRAYFEIPVDYTSGDCRRALYTVVGFRTQGRRDDLESDLVAALWGVFSKAYTELTQRGFDQPLLFWRRVILLEEERDIEADQWFVQITCRVWIPGFSLYEYDMAPPERRVTCG